MMIEWVKKWSKLEDKEVHETKYVHDVLFPEVCIEVLGS